VSSLSPSLSNAARCRERPVSQLPRGCCQASSPRWPCQVRKQCRPPRSPSVSRCPLFVVTTPVSQLPRDCIVDSRPRSLVPGEESAAWHAAGSLRPLRDHASCRPDPAAGRRLHRSCRILLRSQRGPVDEGVLHHTHVEAGSGACRHSRRRFRVRWTPQKQTDWELQGRPAAARQQHAFPGQPRRPRCRESSGRRREEATTPQLRILAEWRRRSEIVPTCAARQRHAGAQAEVAGKGREKALDPAGRLVDVLTRSDELPARLPHAPRQITKLLQLLLRLLRPSAQLGQLLDEGRAWRGHGWPPPLMPARRAGLPIGVSAPAR